MSIRVLVAAVALLAYAAGLRAQEALFSDANAYNPVPNASGSRVAYVLTGRGRVGGSGGMGRSNLKSTLAFSGADGGSLPSAPIEFFLDRWIDASSVSCYRDWHFGIGTDQGLRTTGSMNGPRPSERVTYLATLQTFVWLDDVSGATVLQTPGGPLGRLGITAALDSLVVPSPNEQYLAVASNGGRLAIYNVRTKKSVDLGVVQIHPSADWDYMKPTWDPWFSDSSALIFSTGKSLYISSPDGSRVEEIGSKVSGYLPVPSPDGKSVAYATFVGRPMGVRPDLTFWGDAAIWVIKRGQNESVRLTLSTRDTTLDLRWLDAATLIFDRLSDQAFPDKHTRIWTAKVAQNH
jgi:hypothetical protein